MITTKDEVRKSSLVYVQIHLLKMVLMWPIRSQSFLRSVLIHLYAIIIAVSLCMSSVALLLKTVKTTDLVDRSEAIDILTLTTSAFYKYVFFIYNHHIFKELVDFLDKFPLNQLHGNEDFSMAKWMKWSGPLSIIHSIIGFFCITFWGLCPIFNYVLGFTSLYDMPLPMNVWYAFDYNHGVQYFFLYLLHLFGLISSAHIYMACDGFLFSLVFFMCGQIKNTGASLRGIEDIKVKGYESIDEAKHNGLKKCVELHSRILHFLKELDVVFRSMICADVLHAIISLSFAMLQTSEAKGVLEQIKMATFVGYCFVHQYLNSLFGQLLINQQESLMIEVYGVNWPERPLSFKKSALIMMGAGCIRPVKLSAWRMYFLQYETFVEFVRSMVSFFMVLRTLTEQGMIQNSST